MQEQAGIKDQVLELQVTPLLWRMCKSHQTLETVAECIGIGLCESSPSLKVIGDLVFPKRSEKQLLDTLMEQIKQGLEGLIVVAASAGDLLREIVRQNSRSTD